MEGRVCVFECVCVCVFVWERDCIRESHTQLHSPGDLCQPVILPCTPPSSLLLTAEIGQPHIMKGATRGKYAPPPHTTLSLCSLTPVTSTVQQRRSKPRPPVDTQGAGWAETGTASHNMPTSSHNSHLHSHAWAERIPASHTECAHLQDKLVPSA